MTAGLARLPHATRGCQRWRHRRHSWVPRHRGGFDARRYQITELPERHAREFVTAHHYAGTWPAARLRYGMLDRTDQTLVGVLVLGVPMHPAVLTRPFPDLEPYTESLELARLAATTARP